MSCFLPTKLSTRRRHGKQCNPKGIPIFRARHNINQSVLDISTFFWVLSPSRNSYSFPHELPVHCRIHTHCVHAMAIHSTIYTADEKNSRTHIHNVLWWKTPTSLAPALFVSHLTDFPVMTFSISLVTEDVKAMYPWKTRALACHNICLALRRSVLYIIGL